MAGNSEKQCADRIKQWVVEKKDLGGNPVNLHDRPCLLFDTYLLFGMAASIAGVIFQMKVLAWAACYLSLFCAANWRGKEDFRQVLSSVMVTATSIIMLYNKDPTPIASIAS